MLSDYSFVQLFPKTFVVDTLSMTIKIFPKDILRIFYVSLRATNFEDKQCSQIV